MHLIMQSEGSDKVVYVLRIERSGAGVVHACSSACILLLPVCFRSMLATLELDRIFRPLHVHLVMEGVTRGPGRPPNTSSPATRLEKRKLQKRK